MANSLTDANKVQMSARAGLKQYKSVLYRALASFREEKTLVNGRYVDRPYRNDLVVSHYTKGTELTAQDISYTSNQLQVDQQDSILFYVDDVDAIQNFYSARQDWGEEIGKRITESIDAMFLSQILDAADTIDAGDLGGTAGQGITMTASDVPNLIGKINRKLDTLNVSRMDGFAVFSPQVMDFIWQYIAGKDTGLADATLKSGGVDARGYAGKLGGLDIYMSNNLTATARWTPADNPSNAATITINGITFTFVSTISTVAGNILQTTSLAATIDNLVALINADGVGDGVLSVSLSVANRRVVSDWVATDGTTYFQIEVPGTSYLTLTTSEAADVWTTTLQLQHGLAGKKGCIDTVVQKAPSIDSTKMLSAGKWGLNVGALSLHGHKMFYNGTLAALDLQFNSSGY